MMEKRKKIKPDVDVVDRLVAYQKKLYGGKTIMKLGDIRVECNNCRIHFIPSIDRAKKLMSKYGVINKCKECENAMQEL